MTLLLMRARTYGKAALSVSGIWNETILAKSSRTKFAWREVFEDTENPVLVAFILSPSNGTGTYSNVTMCWVEARWETLDM